MDSNHLPLVKCSTPGCGWAAADAVYVIAEYVPREHAGTVEALGGVGTLGADGLVGTIVCAACEETISEHLAGQGPEWRADALDSRYHVATVGGYPLVRLAVDDRVVRLDCAETREEMAEGLADMPYDEYGVDWDENATDSYVQRAYGDYGDEPGDVTVRIGLDPSTHLWWIDEGDDAEREHYGPYATRAQAEAKMDECLAKDESAEEVQ